MTQRCSLRRLAQVQEHFGPFWHKDQAFPEGAEALEALAWQVVVEAAAETRRFFQAATPHKGPIYPRQPPTCQLQHSLARATAEEPQRAAEVAEVVGKDQVTIPLPLEVLDVEVQT